MIKSVVNLKMRQDCSMLKFTVIDGDLKFKDYEPVVDVNGSISITVDNLGAYHRCADTAIFTIEEAKELRDILNEAITNVENYKGKSESI